MKLIKEKKINSGIMIAIVYLTFCASFWQTSRGSLAYTSMMLGGGLQATIMANELVAFLVGGLVPTLLYELIGGFVFKFTQVRIGGASDDMRYALRYFYIPANLVCFGLKLIYLFMPIASVYGNIIIDFVICAAFFVWYMSYICKNYVDKTRWGAVLYQLGGAFLIVYALITVVTLIMGVVL